MRTMGKIRGADFAERARWTFQREVFDARSGGHARWSDGERGSMKDTKKGAPFMAL